MPSKHTTISQEEVHISGTAVGASISVAESPSEPATRFGIGEWFGKSFTDLDIETRRSFSTYRIPKSSCLKKEERLRLIELRKKSSSSRFTKKESNRLEELEAKFKIERETTFSCPFKELPGYGPVPCTKSGGVCSLRAFEQVGEDSARPATGERGALRITCPNRFHEHGTAFKWAAKEILNQENPDLVGEVGFLESTETYDGAEGEDVGRIDMVVVDSSRPPDHPLPWLALEIQAVYFSGVEMPILFNQISSDIDKGGNGIVYPKDNRRPDYRSCGPKRLMPQLQIKVPTLRRWGKKMAIVVDRPFYRSMGIMQTVSHASLADVVWFVVDFEHDAASGRFVLTKGTPYYMTLEEAVTGLTGGTPVDQPAFEGKIRKFLKSGLKADMSVSETPDLFNS